MLKKNRWMLLLSSVVILLPIVVGALLWDRLPDSIAVHWGVDNEPNGWNSRAFAVFGMPLVILALHWFAIVVTALDPKRKNISDKMFRVLLWICPGTSVLMCVITYGYAMGLMTSIGQIVLVFLGLLIVVLGNYMPKCRQNYTVGMRIAWTLSDPENWKKTHRFAGWTMIIGGVLILVTAFLENPWVSLPIMLIAALAPFIYSYLYHRRHHERGDDT